MKKFIEVAQYYEGCSLRDEDIHLSGGFTNDKTGLKYLKEGYKPVLRPVTRMLQYEALKIAAMLYSEVMVEPILKPHVPSDYLVEGNCIKFWCTDTEYRKVWLMINKDGGIIFIINGTQKAVNQFYALLELMKMGFDLFDLIENGEAVEA